LAGTNVLYHFPLLFAAVSVLSRDSELLGTGRTLNWLELVAVFWSPETISRVMHAVLAAGVVTGVALMAITRWQSQARGLQRGADVAADVQVAARGARIALAAALLQIPAGIWVLWRMPPWMRDQFLAADWTTTFLFASALLAMIVLLHHLAAAAWGDASAATLHRCLILTATLFVLMVGAGHRARAVSAAVLLPLAPASGTSPLLLFRPNTQPLTKIGRQESSRHANKLPANYAKQRECTGHSR
jgi:hypothetical protein